MGHPCYNLPLERVPVSILPEVAILTTSGLSPISPALNVGVGSSIYTSLTTVPTIGQGNSRLGVVEVLLTRAHIIGKIGNITESNEPINLSGVSVILVKDSSVIRRISVIVTIDRTDSLRGLDSDGRASSHFCSPVLG
jgi:hypothetical protein